MTIPGQTDSPQHEGGPAASARPLAGRVAAVTGASQGLGVAIARRLASEGCGVALLARRAGRLKALAEELGPAAVGFPCDVSDPGSVRHAFEGIAESFGRLHVLVNNAGTFEMSLLENASDGFIIGQVATNLVGPMLCSRAAIPLLREAGGGHILNISSRSVELARPYLSVYAGTKGGLEIFSRTLAAELRPNDISVSTIRVGPLATAEVRAKQSGTSAVVSEWVARGGPAPEPPAPPESVADAVVFIASMRPGARIPVVYLEPR
jgi:NAD(P)-dependent dehydrogenase (short-subunit alcohol dehydrogenase family)